MLQSPERDKLTYKVRLQYQATNNEVEYETLLKGLELAKSIEAESILILGDLQLVMGQVIGTCEAKEERIKKYLEKVLQLVKKFKETNFVQIPREENMEADTLKVLQVQNEGNWMAPIISYLKDGTLPERKDEARKLRVQSAKYVLLNDALYKRGFSQPYLRCLSPDEANYMLREVHEGAYGNHLEARALIHKVVRAGYYWPTIQADAKTYVKVCDQCQRFNNIPRELSEYLTPMMAPWPFAQ